MKLASRPPLRRLLDIDRLLRTGRYPNAGGIAAELEVSRRTVYRDLDFLRDFWGAPLEFCPRHNGYHYTEPDYALPPMRLSEGELVALFLAERVMHQYRDTPYEHDLATAFRKLTAQLPGEVTIHLADWQDAYSFRPPPGADGDLRCFRVVARAVHAGRQVELVYWAASRDEVSKRVVDPYHLLAAEGTWYLVGYCHLREAVRMFATSRIRSVRETGERVERPADFRIADYLEPSFRVVRGDGRPRRVRLRFAPSAARYTGEKVWHPSQRLRPRADGGEGRLVVGVDAAAKIA
jgi:predicted DNA-binding transcriptional regulator YafY